MKIGDKVKIISGSATKEDCEGKIIDIYPLEVEKDLFQNQIVVDLGVEVLVFTEGNLVKI